MATNDLWIRRKHRKWIAIISIIAGVATLFAPSSTLRLMIYTVVGVYLYGFPDDRDRNRTRLSLRSKRFLPIGNLSRSILNSSIRKTAPRMVSHRASEAPRFFFDRFTSPETRYRSNRQNTTTNGVAEMFKYDALNGR